MPERVGREYQRNGFGERDPPTLYALHTIDLEKEEIPCCYRELMFTGKLS